MAPEQSDPEKIAEAAKYFHLFRAGIQTLLDLGVPLPQIAASALAIETSATKVEPEPANVSVNVCDTSEPAMPTDLAAKLKPSSVDEAF
jgi:hypothetical protein